MSWVFLILLLSFIVSSFSEGSHEQNQSAVVVGTVYCETCFQSDFSKPSHFISGASVAVECKDGESRPSFRKEVKTDKHGKFKVQLPFSVSKHVKKIKGCSVELIRSSEPYCAVASTATSSSLHLKSRKHGTHIFSAGFFTFKPLNQPIVCNQKPSVHNHNPKLPISGQSVHPNQFLPPNPLQPPLLPPNPLLPPPPPLIPNPFQPPPAPLIPNPFQPPPAPLIPNPFQPPPAPPSPLIPNPFQPPPAPPAPLIPNPFQPPPAPPVPFIPNPFQPPPAPPSRPPSPIFPFPPIPGLTPSPPPPSPPPPEFPFPLPPFPFPPFPPFPGSPPASTSPKRSSP